MMKLFSLWRRKRQAEWETYVRRMVNRYQKDLLVDTHKVKTHQASLGSKLEGDLAHDLHLVCLAGSSHVPDSQWDVPEPSVQGTRLAGHHSVTASHPFQHGR